ncbi:hypothetical protein ANAPH1_00516 [Anaplasma phagocytophilum]|nr:hypothetical protein ANAPH1_00516 [Anaplasma phagocytophilum]
MKCAFAVQCTKHLKLLSGTKIRFGSMVFSVPVYFSSVPKFLIELYL